MARVITRGVIEAYLRCKLKGHLKLAGEKGPRGEYEVLLGELDDQVRPMAVEKVMARHPAATAERALLLTPARLQDGAWLWRKLWSDIQRPPLSALTLGRQPICSSKQRRGRYGLSRGPTVSKTG